MSTSQNRINSLLMQATRETDPAKLRWIAKQLEDYGAWDDAVLVRGKAVEHEREFAELAARQRVRMG